MAMTQLALLFIGGLAVLGTLGFFVGFADRWTALLVEFATAMLWGTFAISALDVIVTEGVDPPVSEPIMPLVYLGIGLAVITFLLALNDLVVGVAGEATETDIGGIGR